MEAVQSVLQEVGAGRVPAIEVFNKCDRLDAAERARLQALYPGALCVSALRGEGREELIAAMEAHLALDTTVVRLQFEPGDARIGLVYRLGRILSHVASDGHVSIEAELPRRVLSRLQPPARLEARGA